MRLAGVVYRAHNPRWSFAPHSGDGAARYGGRFNPVGVPQQGFPFKAQPLTICAYEIDCTDMADLGLDRLLKSNTSKTRRTRCSGRAACSTN